MRLVHVVAVGRNGVIGRSGGLPWRLPGDMRNFRRLTMGKVVISGRKTWESIGRPLPGREVVVVSRAAAAPPAVAPAPPVAGVSWVGSLEEAYEVSLRLSGELGEEEVAVIGGSEIYALTLESVDCLYVTEVSASPSGDVVYPLSDWRGWREVSRVCPDLVEGDTESYEFVVRERIVPAPVTVPRP